MLPDVGHLEEILVDPTLTESVSKQRLVGSRGAGRDHDPVEPLFPYRVRDLLGHPEAGPASLLRERR